MKHLLLIICFLIINTFKLLAQNEIVITGKIYNYKNKPIAIAYYKDYLDYERKITGKTITKKDGSFSMKFKWDYAWPAFLILENETMELFLTPGDSLIIIAKYKKLVKTAKLSGTASYANNYLREHILQFSTMRKQMNKKQKKMKPNEMLLLHDTMYNREMKFFNTLQQNKAPEFYYYIYANIEYYYANRLFTYNLSRAEIEQRMLKIKYNNEDALTSMYYITFLDSYLKFITDIKKQENKNIYNFWDFQFDIIRENFSGWVMDILLARLINKTFNYTTIITTRTLLNKYYNVYKNYEFYNRLERKFNDKNRNY